MSNYVHIRAYYYPRGSNRKHHVNVKVESQRWDHLQFKRVSYLNGHVIGAGGMGSRLINYRETKRTKT